MVVLQRCDRADYRDLAESIARDRGDRVVSDVGEVGPDETTVYVDPPTGISESVLHALCSETRGTDVGIITGRTPAEAEALAFREEEGGGEHVIVVRGINRSVACDDSDTTVLSRDEVTAERLQEVSSGDVSSLSMLVKARDIHATINDGFICGVPADTEAFDFDGVQPSCIVDGRRECIYDRDVLAAEDVVAPHVFICGCSSPLGNNYNGLPVNLGLSFLSGARTLIAPFRPIPVHQYHVALHYSLLRAGYTAAERVRLLNRTAAHAGFGTSQYAPFGRPDAVAANTTEQSFDLERSARDGGYRVSVADVDAHVLDFSVPGDGFDDEQEYFFLRTATDEEQVEPAFYTAFRNGDEIRVVVWSWGRIEADRVDLDLRPSRVLDESPYVPGLSDVGAMADIGLVGGKANRQFTDARNRIKGAASSHRYETFDAGAYRSTRSSVTQAEEGLGRARRTLVEDLVDRPKGLLQETYGDSMYAIDLSTVENGCPYCHRDVHVQTATDVYRREVRSQGICPFHIYVFDTPSAGKELEYPALTGDLATIRHGEERQIEVEFPNSADRRIEASVALRTMSTGDEGEVFSPARRHVEIPADETAAVPFTLDAGEMDPDYNTGDRWFEAIVVTDDLRVYTGMRNPFLFQ